MILISINFSFRKFNNFWYSFLDWTLEYLCTTLLPDVLIVLVCEILVDTIKHAFVTKFNEFPHSVVF